MAIKKRICCGYVVDVAVGQPLHDGYIRLLDKAGKELRFVRPAPGQEWRLVLNEECYSIEFKFSGFLKKSINASVLPKRNARIKLLPEGPVGYVSRTEAGPNDKLELHVHSPQEWWILLHRHGLKKELILKTGSYPPIVQMVPDKQFVEKGLDWTVTTRMTLPGSLQSGLYSITIIDKSDKHFTFPLVVRPAAIADRYQANFVVIGNTNTWQAYNIWGGKSRYRNFDKNPITGDVPLPVAQSEALWTWRRIKIGLIRRVFRLWRYLMRAIKGAGTRLEVSGIRLGPGWTTDPLSIKRPLPNRWLDAEDPHSIYLDHLAANEWRALAWMERENFSYHYFSDRQLHLGEIDFSRYCGIILIGHAEYWTREMYEFLHSAIVNLGVPLVNLAGNAIYQEIEYTDDGGIVPQPGDFLETCTDSSEILCTATDLSVSGFAAFQLSMKSHWAFTGVKNEIAQDNKEVIGNNSLIDANLTLNKSNGKYDPLAPGLLRGDIYGSGASGWEVDKLVKKHRKSALVLAQGLNKNGGADIIIIENSDQHFLFAAPSIAFVSSLLVDSGCSKLTRNILEKLSDTPAKLNNL
jgi:hypothetical protein